EPGILPYVFIKWDMGPSVNSSQRGALRRRHNAVECAAGARTIRLPPRSASSEVEPGGRGGSARENPLPHAGHVIALCNNEKSLMRQKFSIGIEAARWARG